MKKLTIKQIKEIQEQFIKVLDEFEDFRNTVKRRPEFIAACKREKLSSLSLITGK
jgi:Cu2+-containing amine oxidase